MYGLIGFPLGHSFSADFFNNKFKNENIDENYRLFPIKDISCFPILLRNYPQLKGLNVTIPYKETVIPYLDKLSVDARKIGAVNTIKIIRDKEKVFTEGYNTDYIGFKNSIKSLLVPSMKRALILGSGGASKGVVFALHQLGIETTIVSRKSQKGLLTYNDISEEIIDAHHLIVNCTPLGMWPNIDVAPDIPYRFLNNSYLCYDLIYNPPMTAFMKKSKEYGASVKNGLEMLYLQALTAWKIWNN